MPSDIVRYLEWPGIAPAVAKVNMMLAKGPSPALHDLLGHPEESGPYSEEQDLKQEHKVS